MILAGKLSGNGKDVCIIKAVRIKPFHVISVLKFTLNEPQRFVRVFSGSMRSVPVSASPV